jgi:inorganic pyrophosphatase
MIPSKSKIKNSSNYNVVIETPAGSRIKYKYDKDGDYFKVHKIMPTGFSFPCDFGFFPGTKGEDGDPLDAIVLNDFPGAVGSVAECRLIGVICGKQKEKKGEYIRNDRFLMVAEVSHQYQHLKAPDELADLINSLATFFKMYNAAQDRTYKLIGIKKAHAARKLLQ